jgi:hypothetical protein
MVQKQVVNKPRVNNPQVNLRPYTLGNLAWSLEYRGFNTLSNALLKVPLVLEGQDSQNQNVILAKKLAQQLLEKLKAGENSYKKPIAIIDQKTTISIRRKVTVEIKKLRHAQALLALNNPRMVELLQELQKATKGLDPSISYNKTGKPFHDRLIKILKVNESVSNKTIDTISENFKKTKGLRATSTLPELWKIFLTLDLQKPQIKEAVEETRHVLKGLTPKNPNRIAIEKLINRLEEQIKISETRTIKALAMIDRRISNLNFRRKASARSEMWRALVRLNLNNPSNVSAIEKLRNSLGILYTNHQQFIDQLEKLRLVLSRLDISNPQVLGALALASRMEETIKGRETRGIYALSLIERRIKTIKNNVRSATRLLSPPPVITSSQQSDPFHNTANGAYGVCETLTEIVIGLVDSGVGEAAPEAVGAIGLIDAGIGAAGLVFDVIGDVIDVISAPDSGINTGDVPAEIESGEEELKELGDIIVTWQSSENTGDCVECPGPGDCMDCQDCTDCQECQGGPDCDCRVADCDCQGADCDCDCDCDRGDCEDCDCVDCAPCE